MSLLPPSSFSLLGLSLFSSVPLVRSPSHLPRRCRAKRIQNRAVVNESPTERLVKELKAENARLLQRLSRLGQEGRRANDETSEAHFRIKWNRLQLGRPG